MKMPVVYRQMVRKRDIWEIRSPMKFIGVNLEC